MNRPVAWALGSIFALALLALDVSTPSTMNHATIGIAPAAARAKTSVMRCVKYSQTQEDTAMALALESSCKLDLECTMTWSLRCHSENGKTESRKESSSFTLDAGQSQTVVASADLCGEDGWSIGNVRWTCRDAAE